jgi:alanyl-tRNA synthetase
LKDQLLNQLEKIGEVNFIAQKVKVPSADALKQLAYDLKAKIEDLFCVLVADIQGKPQIAVMIDENLVKTKNYHAGNIVKELAKEIQGGGGGQPFFATAGGKDSSGLDKVVSRAKMLV